MGIIIFVMLFPLWSFSQTKPNFSAKGLVKDETGSPMVDVTVQLKGTSVATIPDIDGTYSLSGTVPDGEYLLSASFVGYANSSQKVQVPNASSSVVLDFDMSPDVLNLDEIVVTANTSTWLLIT